MPPLHSALTSPSYDEFLASLRRDLTFEVFVAAMRLTPPQSLFRLLLLVLHRLLSLAPAALRVAVCTLIFLPLCALLHFRLLTRPCWPLICMPVMVPRKTTMFMMLLRPLLLPAWYRLFLRLLVPCPCRLSWCL